MHHAFTVIGDPHITLKSLDRAQELFRIVETQGRDCIWLGDILDTKEVIRGKCLNAFNNYIKSSELRHIILVGNHDYFNLECEDHSLQVLKNLPNVVIVDKYYSEQGIAFIPYIHDQSALKSVLEAITERTLFCHVDVSGFDYGNGHICENGLKLEDLSKFKRVVSGHFHKFQRTKNLTYLGSPFSHSFGESDQIKFIAEYDVVNDDLIMMETGLPQHRTFKYLELSSSDRAPLFDFIEIHKNDIIRVELHGTQQEINAFPRENAYNIKWVPKPTETSNNKIVLEEGTDNHQQFVKWAKEVRNLDQDTVELGLKILEGISGK